MGVVDGRVSEAMKNSDGHQLEELVAFVEQSLVPKGITVALNRTEYNAAGTAIAEFDIEVTGKVGSGEIRWLIECRDRPSEGAAPSSWIEQLVGRRDRFGFNKVTAVSATGFSPGAREYASEAGIELREVKSIASNEFAWLALEYMTQRERLHNLQNASLTFARDQPAEIAAELAVILKANNGNVPFLIDKAGESVSPVTVFMHSTSQIDGMWDDVIPDGLSKQVDFLVAYREDDRFHIVTSHGDAPVTSIRFTGQISIVDRAVPPKTIKYEAVPSRSTISEIATFPLKLGDMAAALEIHRIEGAEGMQVILRSFPE